MTARGIADPAEAGREDTLRAVQSLAFLTGLCLCLILSLGFALSTFERAESSPMIGSGERLNPNEAPAASLMRLPRIGAARAQAIVAHRDRAASEQGQPLVFHQVDDLQQIKGIGPALVEDLRPWLQFEDFPQDANQLPAR